MQKKLFKVYRVSRGWKLFLGIGLSAMMCLIGWITILYLTGDRFFKTSDFVFETGAFLLCLYGLIITFNDKIELYPDRIKEVGLFGSSELLINEISGFSMHPSRYFSELRIVPRNPKLSEIKIAFIFEHQDDLLEWLNRNLINLTPPEFQNKTKPVRHNTGSDEAGKQKRGLTSKTKRWSNTINSFAVIMSLWAALIPNSPHFVIWTLIIMPVVTLSLMAYSDDILKFIQEPYSEIPGIGTAFLIPCIALTVRAVFDFNILSWDQFWFPFAFFSLSLFVLSLLLSRDARQNTAITLMLILFCAFYGYSTLININGILDTSIPSVHKVEIMRKNIIKGNKNGNTYSLVLSPWEYRRFPHHLNVKKDIYDMYKIGSDVNLFVRDGKFGIPYFYADNSKTDK